MIFNSDIDDVPKQIALLFPSPYGGVCEANEDIFLNISQIKEWCNILHHLEV